MSCPTAHHVASACSFFDEGASQPRPLQPPSKHTPQWMSMLVPFWRSGGNRDEGPAADAILAMAVSTGPQEAGQNHFCG